MTIIFGKLGGSFFSCDEIIFQFKRVFVIATDDVRQGRVKIKAHFCSWWLVSVSNFTNYGEFQVGNLGNLKTATFDTSLATFY